MNSMDDASGNPGYSVLVSKRYTEDEVNTIVSELEKVKNVSQKQSEEIDNLKKLTKNLNDRLRDQERYTKKDSIIIVNPPFDARKFNDMTADALKFFQTFLKIHIPSEKIKACHVLPNTGNAMQLPSVICKLLYFDDKNNVYSKRWHLKKKNNPINRKNIYINEPLPEIENGIANETKKGKMIVSTHNCVVSVLVENGINKPNFMRVNELEDLDRVNAIKKNKTATMKNWTGYQRIT